MYVKYNCHAFKAFKPHSDFINNKIKYTVFLQPLLHNVKSLVSYQVKYSAI